MRFALLGDFSLSYSKKKSSNYISLSNCVTLSTEFAARQSVRRPSSTFACPYSIAQQSLLGKNHIIISYLPIGLLDRKRLPVIP